MKNQTLQEPQMDAVQRFSTRGGVTFYIRRTRTDAPTMIYATYYLNTQKCHEPVGVKVKPSQWDRESRKAIIKESYTSIDNYNNRVANIALARFKVAILNIFLYFCTNGGNSNKTNKINIMAKTTKTQTNAVTQGCVTELMKNLARESNVDRSYSTECSKIKRLEEYLKKKRLPNTFGSMTYEAMDGFKGWLFSSKRNLGWSTADQTLRAIKKYLKKLGNTPTHRYDYDSTKIQGIISPKDPRGVDEVEENYIALTHEQIEQFANLYVSDDFLSICRDLFLIQCYTGIRVSDINQFLDAKNFKMIDNQKYVVFIPNKNKRKSKKRASIPLELLYPALVPIYEKHKGESYDFLPTEEDRQPNQVYNEAIRELGRRCGWEQKVQITSTKGVKKIVEQYPLYKRLKSHVGRHTFITNAIREFKLSAEKVIYITGHKNTSIIDKVYLNLQNEDGAKIVTDAIIYKQTKTKPVVSNSKSDTKNFGIPDKMEALSVLKYLDVYNPAMDNKTFEELIYEIAQHQGRLYDDYGIKYEVMKPLFNWELPLAKRRKLLQAICDELLN